MSNFPFFVHVRQGLNPENFRKAIGDIYNGWQHRALWGTMGLQDITLSPFRDRALLVDDLDGHHGGRPGAGLGHDFQTANGRLPSLLVCRLRALGVDLQLDTGGSDGFHRR